jgi:hypothetical protein
MGRSSSPWCEQILPLAPRPGDIVVMVNLAAHKVPGIRQAIEAQGATLLYLPPGPAFLLETITPFTARARASASGFTGGLRRLPTKDHFGQPLSTKRCQAGILMEVHSALPRIVDVSTTSASSAQAGWTTY